MDTNGYVSYQNYHMELSRGISVLERVCEPLELKESLVQLKEMKQKIQNHRFAVGIMGEFKRGKSTVINALLGKKIVPVDPLPCSATLNRIMWATTPSAEIIFKEGMGPDGKEKITVPIEEMESYVTKLTDESSKQSDAVEEAIVYYPVPFCQNGVEIIDTPGLNDDDRMQKVAEKVIPKLDAIIMVITPDSPFSMSEADFVRNKVMTSDLGRIIFVVNKIDTIDEEDRPRVIEGIRNKIIKSVKEKMASMYGEGSEEYKNAVFKLGDIKIFGISGRDALKGKTKGDQTLLKESGMLEFEEALTHLLTVERGTLELLPKFATLKNTCATGLRMLDIKKESMEMDATEFEQKQQELIASINTIREEKKVEIDVLKNNAANAYYMLREDIEQVYTMIEEELLQIIIEYPISQNEVSGKNAVGQVQEELQNKLTGELERLLVEQSEILIQKLNTIVANDINNVMDWSNSLRSLPTLSTANPNGKLDLVGVVTDTIASSLGIIAIGGFISGYNTAGIKGMLVGGASGWVAGLIAGAAAVSVGVVGLPLCLIIGATSTFAGKGMVNVIFRNDQRNRLIDEIRSNASRTMSQHIEYMRNSHILEEWLRTQTNDVYTEISKKLDREIENILESTSANLIAIQEEKALHSVNCEAVLEETNGFMKELQELVTSLERYEQKLVSGQGGCE